MGHFYVRLSLRTGIIQRNNIAFYQILNNPQTKKIFRNQRRKVLYMRKSG